MKTITIAHSKGGVGKSTLAWNLSVALDQRQYRVCLIDLDVQRTLTHTNHARSLDRSGLTVLHPGTVAELVSMTADASFDFHIVDVGGYDFDLGRAAIANADRVVVPISDNPTELFGFVTFAGFIDEIRAIAPVPPISMVINNVHPRASRFDSIRSLAALCPEAVIADTVIRRRMVYAASMGNGFGVTEMGDKFPQAASEIAALTEEVTNGTL